MSQNTQPSAWFKSIGSFLVILFLMPLGHALMIIMEHNMTPTALHYGAFLMGLVGLLVVIWGVFVKGDTRQTIVGLCGSMLFWTGWIEFLLAYYAQRYGAHPTVTDGDLMTVTHYVNGVAQSTEMFYNGQLVEGTRQLKEMGVLGSRPEYLMMPGTFGLFMMMMVLYTFCVRNGCNFICWIQEHIFGSKRTEIVARPMTRHTSIVVFMEWQMMMWGCYLLCMFMYDETFLGDHHPLTIGIAIGCLVGSVFMFRRQLKMNAWGPNLRMALATVIVFWTFVEVFIRMGLMKEIWVEPETHQTEMWSILAAFVILIAFLVWQARRPKKGAE